MNQLLEYHGAGEGSTNALAYRRAHKYVPPYYPDRDEGVAACVLKLLGALILFIPAGLFLLIAMALPLLSVMTPTERAAGFVALTIGTGVFATPSILLARRSVMPLWKRWKTARLRGERGKPLQHR